MHGGFGSAVMEFFASRGMDDIKIRPIGVPDRFIEHGSVAEQRREVGLTVERIVTEVKSLLPLMRQRA